MDNNELWILSASQSVYDDFEKIFFETFGWPLALYNPGTLGVDFPRMLHGLSVSLDDNLNIVPADFRGDAQKRAGLPGRNSESALAETDLF
jgi:hypothetical protein